jgi:phenylacetate-CoA ligase
MDPWGKLARLSRQEIRSLQNKKLHHFINTYLYPFSPHYQEHLDRQKINPQNIKTVEDLQQIPFTSKLHFVATPERPEKFREFILQPDKFKIRKYWPASKLLQLMCRSALHGSADVQEQLSREFRPCFMTFTTGTTSKPISYLYSDYDIANLYISGSRMLDLFSIESSERIINMFPYAPHLAFWQVVFGGLASGFLTMSTGGGKVMGTDGNIAAILKMKPSVIMGVPSYVYHVLRLAKNQGCKLDFVKKVVLGAARISEGFKIKLAGMLEAQGARDVSVFGTYGFTEARSAWAECPTSNDVSSGYHLYPDKEIFEVIDPATEEVQGEGKDGELVYTAIDARGSAVLRYRTGDFVRGGITYEPCPYCQRTVPRISSEITRLSDVKDLQLSKIKGSLVNLNNFTSVLSEIHLIDEWQIELKKKDNDPFEIDEVDIYACVKKDCDKAQLEAEIKKKMLLATEVTPNAVHFISLEEMVNRLELEFANKAKRIVDKRPET